MKITKNKEEIGWNYKVPIVCQNSFGILVDFDNSEDNKIDNSFQPIIGGNKFVKTITKELEIKEELCDIKIIAA